MASFWHGGGVRGGGRGQGAGGVGKRAVLISIRPDPTRPSRVSPPAIAVKKPVRWEKGEGRPQGARTTTTRTKVSGCAPAAPTRSVTCKTWPPAALGLGGPRRPPAQSALAPRGGAMGPLTSCGLQTASAAPAHHTVK